VCVLQALAEFAGVSVAEASASLHAAGGELADALQQQLLRVPVREEVLLELVHEYCVTRGLPTPPVPPREHAAAPPVLGLDVYKRADEPADAAAAAAPAGAAPPARSMPGPSHWTLRAAMALRALACAPPPTPLVCGFASGSAAVQTASSHTSAAQARA
jgi:hypothetical protein